MRWQRTSAAMPSASAWSGAEWSRTQGQIDKLAMARFYQIIDCIRRCAVHSLVNVQPDLHMASSRPLHHVMGADRHLQKYRRCTAA